MNKVIHCLFLTLGIILGFYLSFLFGDTGVGKTSTRISPVFINPAVIQRTVAAREGVYVRKVDSLSYLNKQLTWKVAATKNTLLLIKRDNNRLQQQANGVMADLNANLDTTNQLAYCDSLQYAVQKLIESDNEKDSVYNVLTENLFMQVSNRDSTIAVQQFQYHEIKSSFDSLANQQQPLISENLQLKHLIHKQRKKGKILSTGALILGSIAIYGLMQQR